MKKIITFCLCFLYIASSSGAEFIDDGISAQSGSFPSVVKIVTYDPVNVSDSRESFCTGTLLSPNVVLTAAHCINHDEGKKQKVSLVGDHLGGTDKAFLGLVYGGGIKVTESFYPNDYKKHEKNVERLAEISAGPMNDDFGGAEKKAVIKEYNKAVDLMAAHDLAILILEKNQDTENVILPTIGCRKLSAGAEVMLAGYGRARSFNTMSYNANLNFVLNFGYNKIEQSLLYTYSLTYQEGQAMGNAGDSGGPLFRKDDQSVVYGVLSSAIQDYSGKALKNIYAQTSSIYAKNFFKELLHKKSLPDEVRAVLGNCF